MKRYKEAESALRQTIVIAPENMSYLTAVAQFYLSQGKLAQARHIADQMIVVAPDNPLGNQLLEFIKTREPQK